MPAGTITLTNGSATVTGESTSFKTEISAGEFLLSVDGQTNYTLPVTAVNSDTELTLSDGFTGPTASGLSYRVISSAQLVSVPTELINQTTEAIRGLNNDKANWNQLLTVDGDVTITAPDGTEITGPSWPAVSKGIDAGNLDKAQQIADQSAASAAAAAQSEANASDFASAASASEANAETSASDAAASAQSASDTLSNIGDALDQAQASATAAAESASDAANSASAAHESEENAAQSEQNAANSASAAAGSEQAVADNAAAAAQSESNAAASESAAANSASASSTSASNAATSEANSATSATSAATDAQTATDSIQQTLTNVQDAQAQADRATTEADRAETEADKLGNTNDFAAILDTIDIDNADVTFKGNVAGADAVDDNDFVTLSQLHNITLMSDDFEGLGELVPVSVNQLAMIRAHTAGTNYGGGVFKAVAGSGTTDGGMIHTVNDDFHWRRDIDAANVDITMFGGIPDGVTDAADSMLAMYEWASGLGGINQHIGIRLPSGEIALSKLAITTDAISFFRLHGAGSNHFGYLGGTRLILTGEADSIAIDIQCRWVEIGNLSIVGQFDVDSVVRHFFKNSLTQGQYFNLHSIDIREMGGRTFQLVDTLDTKLNQFYTHRLRDNFLRVLASGELSWDHSTAIELSNFNIQTHLGESDQQGVLFIPNCSQSMIWNGWIEHCTYPGNLTLGEWSIRDLAMETNDNPLYMGQSRVSTYNCSNATGAGIDVITDMTVNAVTGEYESRSLSLYEAGRTQFYSHGVYIEGALKTTLNYAGQIYSNSGNGSQVWVRVGRFVGSATAEVYVIKCIGRTGFATPGTATGGIEGFSEITIQNRGTLTNTVQFNGFRTSAITDVRYEKNFTSDTIVYVRVNAFSRVGFEAFSTGTSRLDAGEHSYIDWDMSVISDDDLAAIDGLQTAFRSAAWGTSSAGIVADGDNNLLGFYTGTKNTGAINLMNVQINGAAGGLVYLTGNNFMSLGHSEIADLPSAAANPWKVRFTRGFDVANSDGTTTTYPAGLVYSNGNGWFLINGEQIAVTGAAT